MGKKSSKHSLALQLHYYSCRVFRTSLSLSVGEYHTSLNQDRSLNGLGASAMNENNAWGHAYLIARVGLRGKKNQSPELEAVTLLSWSLQR